MMMTMADLNPQQPISYPVDCMGDLDASDSRLSTCSDDDSSAKVQDRFRAMFESSDRTQAGSCVLKPSSTVLRDCPLSKVQEERTDFRFSRRDSTISTEWSELSSSFRKNSNIDDASTNAAGIVKLQAAVRGFLERAPRGPAPPVHTIRPNQKWRRRLSDLTMYEFGESFSSYITSSSNTTDPEGSSELSFGPRTYPRSRNQSMDTLTQSVEGDTSYTLRNSQSVDTFDVCLEKELQHLDISGEMIKEDDVAEKEGCHDGEDGSSSMPRLPIRYRQVSSDTAFAVAGDEPARAPVRRESQFIAHDVSSLTDGSTSSGSNRMRSKQASNKTASSKKSLKRGGGGSGSFFQRFWLAPVMPVLKRGISLVDVPLGIPKRRVSKQAYRTSAPVAL
jgi:hypothetical protein